MVDTMKASTHDSSLHVSKSARVYTYAVKCGLQVTGPRGKSASAGVHVGDGIVGVHGVVMGQNGASSALGLSAQQWEMHNARRSRVSDLEVLGMVLWWAESIMASRGEQWTKGEGHTLG